MLLLRLTLADLSASNVTHVANSVCVCEDARDETKRRGGRGRCRVDGVKRRMMTGKIDKGREEGDNGGGCVDGLKGRCKR